MDLYPMGTGFNDQSDIADWAICTGRLKPDNIIHFMVLGSCFLHTFNTFVCVNSSSIAHVPSGTFLGKQKKSLRYICTCASINNSLTHIL